MEETTKENTILKAMVEEKVTKIMDSGGTVDLLLLDFSKAFVANHRFKSRNLKLMVLMIML